MWLFSAQTWVNGGFSQTWTCGPGSMVAQSDLDLWTWVSGRPVRPGLVDLGQWSHRQTWTCGPGSVVVESDLDLWTWVSGHRFRPGLVDLGQWSPSQTWNCGPGQWSPSQTWTCGPGSVVAESDLDSWTWVGGHLVRPGLVDLGQWSQSSRCKKRVLGILAISNLQTSEIY